MAAPEIEVFTFGTPVTNIVITPPEGTWMTEIIAYNLGMDSADLLKLTVGNVTTSTYLTQEHNAVSDDVGLDTFTFFQSHNVTTGGASHAMVYGLDLVAPTVIVIRPLDIGDVNQSVSGCVQTGITAHTTIELFTNAGNKMNSGTIYAVHHKRAHSLIETVDFGAAAAASHSFTGLTQNSLVLCSPNLGLAASSGIELHLSADGGSTWDTGATDYRRGRINHLSAVQGDDERLFLPGFTATTQAFFAVIENMQVACPTTLIEGASVADADTGPFQSAGFRTNVAIHDALRIKTFAADNMNSGKLYLMGA